MKQELLKIIGQLQYEISLLDIDEENLTGVDIRTEDLKEFANNIDCLDIICIDGSVDGLTLGKKYKEIYKDKTHTRVEDDYGIEGLFYSNRFTIV